MKLLELEPQWLTKGEARVGLMFRCPCCVRREKRRTWLTVFWVGMPIWGEEVNEPGRWSGQMGAIRRALDALGFVDECGPPVVPCKEGLAWLWNGAGFDGINVSPSLDASAAGHWHGFITNGEIA